MPLSRRLLHAYAGRLVHTLNANANHSFALPRCPVCPVRPLAVHHRHLSVNYSRVRPRPRRITRSASNPARRTTYLGATTISPRPCSRLGQPPVHPARVSSNSDPASTVAFCCLPPVLELPHRQQTLLSSRPFALHFLRINVEAPPSSNARLICLASNKHGLMRARPSTSRLPSRARPDMALTSATAPG